MEMGMRSLNPEMDFPKDFRCPISMELMKDPVTISTGVTYERKNIENWFFTYKKKTCPTTMQSIENFDVTPNNTLKRLILSWQNGLGHSSPSTTPPRSPLSSIKHDELVMLLKNLESTPFKVSSLKKLRCVIEMGDEMVIDFRKLGGVEVLFGIIVQVLVDNSDFVTFRACEEALGVLSQLPLTEEDEITSQILSKPECMKSMAIMLQRGSAEARVYTISIFHKMAKADFNWNIVIQDQGMDLFKSMLDLVSDEICTKASSLALQVMIEILVRSKKSRIKAIEAGASCTLVELLADSNRSKCERILQVIKLLCECAEGRSAFIEHGLGIAAVSKNMLHVSDTASKIGVKILYLICSFNPTERVLEEMLVFGAVKKLVAMLHITTGRSSTKEKVIKMFKMHGNSWKRYPCFPVDLRDYLNIGRE